MQIVVLLTALTVFLLLTALLYNLGRKIDETSVRLKRIKNSASNLEIIDEELKLPLSERIIKPIKGALANTAKKMVPGSNQKNNSVQKKSSKSREKTIRALHGADLNISYEEFSLIKLGAVVLLGTVGFFLAKLLSGEMNIMILGIVFGLVLGLWLPIFIISKKGKSRRAAILHDLPEVMDLLVVSVEAGLGLDAAITRLYEKNKSPLLRELMKTVRDAQMGLPRRDSLQAMAERCGVPELKAFSSSMIQAEQLGVSIKKVLRSQADQLRLAYRQRCEAKAMKAPVKMMIPMVVFIFPVLFIILLGPSVPKIMEMFK